VRVLFYYSSPEWTGSARVFAAAGRGLAARGYQVTFVCPGGGVVEARAAAEGCDVIPLEATGSALVRGWRLQRILSERFVETAFVHTEAEHVAVAVAMRMAGRGGIVRRSPAGARPVVGRGTRMAARLVTTGFVFTSAADADHLPAISGVRAPVIADIGIDADRYSELRAVPASALGASAVGTPRVIVCVYEPTDRGSAATMLRTMALLVPRHPELHLAILGLGSRGEDLRMHAAALGITRQVSYLGERDDDLAVLRAADVGWVVAPSDTGGYAALDFMAMRIPVLTDALSVAARYVADGITGSVIAPGDTSAAAASIARLLAQGPERTAMGNAARARVARQYTESAMLDGLQQAADAARDRTHWSR
jgi:glycosyltransferase involved in cell wall biosynthesis